VLLSAVLLGAVQADARPVGGVAAAAS